MPGARDGQLRMTRGSDTPPWSLQLWDDGAQEWRTVGRVDVALTDAANTLMGDQTIVGDLLMEDALTPTQSYRFRTSGDALDIEGGGQSLYLSVWDNADFTGTQHTLWQWGPGWVVIFRDLTPVPSATYALGGPSNYWSCVYTQAINLTADNTTTTGPASGSADALPGPPAGWLEVTIGGTLRKIPYW